MKRPRNFEREDNYQQSKYVKGYKKTRKDYDGPDAPQKEVVAASTIAVKMPSEIKPEGVAN